MTDEPTITTARLILRPWHAGDATALHQLAGRREIADTMISVPHPFTLEYATEWIVGTGHAHAKGHALHFAITEAPTGSLVGAAELRSIDTVHSHAELSFWIGVNWWGQGFATEVVHALVRHGFDQLHLNRILAYHMVRNPASGQVLKKAGLQQEGLLRQCVKKWSQFEDVVLMAVLHDDWRSQNRPNGCADLP
jgi:RimJ/RimL family protein N-acetyltransferase